MGGHDSRSHLCVCFGSGSLQSAEPTGEVQRACLGTSRGPPSSAESKATWQSLLVTPSPPMSAGPRGAETLATANVTEP